MFEKIRKQPILQIVLLALVIIIIIAVFTPRGGRLTAGLNVNAHVGSLKGGFNFETFGNKGTLALFHADWCGHCKRLMPEFENFEQSYNGPMSIMKVNEAQDKEMNSLKAENSALHEQRKYLTSSQIEEMKRLKQLQDVAGETKHDEDDDDDN